MASIEYAPGTSPFHTKGNLYLGTEAFFAAHHQEGIRAVYAQLTDPALVAFIQQKFLVGGWYDALPVAQLIRAEARAMKLSMEEYLRVRTLWQAKSDMTGVYRALLRLVTPQAVAERYPKLVGRYFDFGELSASVEREHIVHLVAKGVPSTLAYWWSTVFGQYAATVIEMAGAKRPRSRLFGIRPEGQLHGVDIVRFEVEIAWEG